MIQILEKSRDFGNLCFCGRGHIRTHIFPRRKAYVKPTQIFRREAAALRIAIAGAHGKMGRECARVFCRRATNARFLSAAALQTTARGTQALTLCPIPSFATASSTFPALLSFPLCSTTPCAAKRPRFWRPPAIRRRKSKRSQRLRKPYPFL